MKRVLLSCLLLLPAAALAETGITAKGGTLGLGVELNQSFNEYLGLRVGLNDFSYSYDTTEDDIEYNFDLELSSKSLLLDIHPFGGNFRISAGILKNDNQFQGNAASQSSYTVGNNTYTPQEIGVLSSTVGFDDTAPYLSLGWAQQLEDSGLGFALEIGAIMQGEPEATLTATGALSNPQLQDDLQREEESLENDMKDFDTYPVISFGISYKF